MPDAAPPTVYVDDVLLAFNKPPGLLCVPGRGLDKLDSLSTRALRQWPQARVVHRLDQATSGLVLMAQGLHWQRTLSRFFEMRQVRKTYLAAVSGRLSVPDGADGQGWQTIDLPIGPDWPQRPRQQVDRQHGRASQTRWRPLDQSALASGRPLTTLPTTLPTIEAPHTWLEIEPLTGRTHQIRVHLAAMGMPILGDALYASPAASAGTGRLMLHAWRLVFAQPASGQDLELQAPWLDVDRNPGAAGFLQP